MVKFNSLVCMDSFQSPQYCLVAFSYECVPFTKHDIVASC
jgi:hypothetical protein